MSSEPPPQSFGKQIDGFPSVRRFSSLLDYLDLCEVGVFIHSGTLDCELHKNAYHDWVGYEDEPLTARGVVEAIRFCLSEDDPDCNLDQTHVIMSPVDKVTIKREIAAGHDEDSGAEDSGAGDGLAVGMTLAKFIYDESVEDFVLSYDSGAAGSAIQPTLSDYSLPLHVRLPALEKGRRVLR